MQSRQVQDRFFCEVWGDLQQTGALFLAQAE
jgi:hypothetical protein